MMDGAVVRGSVQKDKLYSSIVHFYMDKKGYTMEKANQIAQSVVKREAEKKTCKNSDCGHQIEDHMRDGRTCLVPDCDCLHFVKA